MTREEDIKQAEISNEKLQVPHMQHLTVEELYDKDKYDLSTMEPGDVFALLQ